MKRSEMVEKIYNYMLVEMGDSYEEAHIHNCKIDAEAVMKIIEEAGMLPPEATFKREWATFGSVHVDGKKIDGSGGKVYMTVKERSWEPEEDKT